MCTFPVLNLNLASATRMQTTLINNCVSLLCERNLIYVSQVYFEFSFNGYMG